MNLNHLLASKVKRAVPRPVRRAIRRSQAHLNYCYDYFMDGFDLLASRRDPLVPARHLSRFAGDGNYKKTGREFLQYFEELGGLRPGDRVLDIGSGLGRMALPLTAYLSADGSYEGVDILARGVKWCTENITPRFPNFHFLHADVRNKAYNPEGREPASGYVLPYGDASFDFVFLTSVFTHMLPAEVANYLGQISRVLKSNGRCLITFFFMNEEASGLVKNGKSSWNFKFHFGDYFVVDEDVREAAVAYDESYVRRLYDATGLRIDGPVHYGSWCGRQQYLSYQDIVLATRAMNSGPVKEPQ